MKHCNKLVKESILPLDAFKPTLDIFLKGMI